MNRFIVDEGLQSKLDQLQDQTQFCDKDGRVLGVFIPALADDREHRQYERARAQYSAEEVAELEQLSNERAGMTTDQVMQRLRELAAG